MSSTRFLKNAITRHQLFLQQFGTSESKTLQLAVVSARGTAKRLMGAGELINKTRPQQLRIIERIGLGVRAVYDAAILKSLSDMDELTLQELGFNQDVLSEAVNVNINPARAATVDRLIYRTKIAYGLDQRDVMKTFMNKFSRKKTTQITQVIRDGIVNGQSSANIRRSLNSVSRFQTNQANALIRTVINHVSSGTREAIAQNNRDVVKNYIFVAELDDRTTYTCAGLDGKQLPLDTVNRPPMHIACRSDLVPNVKPEFSVFTEDRAGIPGRVARGPSGKTTRIAGTSTYDSWLRKQPLSFQTKALGENRAKLFRSGGMRVERFTNDRFRTLTLKELKATNPIAFDKAGLT